MIAALKAMNVDWKWQRQSGPWLLAALLAVLCLPGPELDAQSRAEARQPPPDVIVEVGGLSCPFCAYGIEKKFVELDPVDSVFVALEENEVRLWLERGGELSDEDVRQTVNEAGFTPGAIRRPARSDARRR